MALLDHTVSFLNQKDGIDKVLKTVRYAAGLGALVVKDEDDRLKKIDATLSTCRKALRLGKFLSNVKKLRDLKDKKDASDKLNLGLAVVFNCSESVYYFLDQIQFLVKAKVIKKSNGVKHIKKLATYAEIVSYASDSMIQLLSLRKISSELKKTEGAKDGRNQLKKAELEHQIILLQNLAVCVHTE